MNKYTITEYELFEPLSEYDSQRYDDYSDRIAQRTHLLGIEAALRQLIANQRRKATLIEQNQLIELEKQRLQHIVEPWEEADWSRLCARRHQQKELVNYRWEVRDSAFAKFDPPQIENWCGGFNLSAMTKQYERIKAVCGTSKACQSLARRKQDEARKNLAQLDQNESEIWHKLDPNHELREAHRAILSEVLGELFEKFLQHVGPDANASPFLATAVLNNATVVSMTSEDYSAIHLARSVEAEAHDRNIAALQKSKGYANWYEMRDKESSSLIVSGNGYQPFFYPRPYSDTYFWRFLHLIMRTSLAELKAGLHHQFFGDQVDGDYIEGLLLRAERECHLIEEGAIVIADSEGVIAIQDPYTNWPFGAYPDKISDFSDSLCFGGSDFNIRAKIVRDWCKEVASIIPPKLSDLERDTLIRNAKLLLDATGTMSSTDVLPTATSQILASSPSAKRKSSKGTAERDQRDATIDLDKFLNDIKTADFDVVAKAAGFWPPTLNPTNGGFLLPNRKVTCVPARLNVVYDLLREKGYWKGQKQDIIPIMSQRLGWPKLRIDNTKGHIYESVKSEALTVADAVEKRIKSEKASKR